MALFERGFDIGGGLKDVFSSDGKLFGGNLPRYLIDPTKHKGFFQNNLDPGSVLFGGASKSNSLGMNRDGTNSKFFGDRALGIDWMGSPITAGTNFQGPARLGAILYGGYSALGGLGGLGGTSATAAPSTAGATGGGAYGTAGTTGTSGGGVGSSGGMTPMQMLQWGRRGYNAYNLLRNMGGGGQQPGGPMPMQRPMYAQGPQQRPIPGSGPFDWLKL